MSILVGPFERHDGQVKTDREEKEDLLMFGYACKLYRDDAKALMEDSGQLLIPWMGDHSLMVDRYDVRNRLEDKNQFGLKSNLPYRPTPEEVELEEELDQERYLALECDDIRVAEQEEEEKKRQRESSFSAVGFSYNNVAPPSTTLEEDDDPPLLACYPQRQQEHPPTSSVDHGEEEEGYSLPTGLTVPNYIQTPTTNKLHSIIEKTALFIVKQGAQMEIIIKAKQKFNPFFSFLDHSDDLFPYYQHIKAMLKRGAYVPKQSSPAPPPPSRSRDEDKDEEEVKSDASAAQGGLEGDQGSNETTTRTNGNESSATLEENGEMSSGDELDSDDEGGSYLHPLLMGGGVQNSSKSSTPTPGTRESSPTVQVTSAAAMTTPTPSSATSSATFTTSSIAFYSKRMSINSAPIIDTKTSSDPSGPPRVATSSSGASTASGDVRQYGRESSSQEGYPPSSVAQSSSYPGHYSYDYQQERHGETGTQYPDAYSAHYYAQDGNYYDGTRGPAADGAVQYDYQAYYHQSADDPHQYNGSVYSATPSAPPPPPSDLLPVVTKTAEYVAKNGDQFERTVIERHAGDPRFGFLNPWDKSHAYYQMLKQQFHHRIAYEAYSLQMGWNQAPLVAQGALSSEVDKENVLLEPNNLQRLNESGAVSFKLQPPRPTKAFDPSSLVDLGSSEDAAEEGEGQSASADYNGDDEDGQPPSKKPRTEWTKMGTKVEEFLSTVKAIFGTE